MTKMSKCMTATALAAAMSAPSALAADLPKEGSYDFMSCYSGTSNPMVASNSLSANTTEIFGTIQTNPPGGLFDKVAFRCISWGYSAAGKATGATLCEGVDKDGDKYFTHLENDGQKTTRQVVAGTGKYDGMVASGTSENTGPFGALKPGTIQSCTHQKGTYKMK